MALRKDTTEQLVYFPRHLLMGLAQRRGIGKALRDRLAGHATSEAKLRIMSRVVVFGAVARRLAAAPGHRGNGTRSKIMQAEELFQELRSLGLQSCKIVWHRGLLSLYRIQPVRIYTLRILPQKKET